MKHLLLIFFGMTFIVVKAQNIAIENPFTRNPEMANQILDYSKHEILDRAIIVCLYEHSVLDSVLDKVNEYYEILQIGKNLSICSDYYSYKKDSAIYKREGQKIQAKDAWNLSKKYLGEKKTSYTVLKNYITNTIYYDDRITTDHYNYTEPMSIFDWSLSSETKIVCGYACNKATTTFRGRKWNAYYTSDIPVNDGPWKFCGLPGLILLIEDATGEHKFRAISIRKSDEEIRQKKLQSKPITREKFNAELLMYKNNPDSYLSGSPLKSKDANGNEIKSKGDKMFYNPIELE